MKRKPNILIAFKKSRYEQYRDEGEEDLDALLASDDVSVTPLLSSHERHATSLQAVVDAVRERGVEPDVLYRGDVTATDDYDLVIAAGGDGTVLDLSHRIADVPLLGVNTDPSMSVGYFCAGTASQLPELLDRTLEGAWEPLELTRFTVRINGAPVGYPVLNDVLFCHQNPAAVSRYVLRIGDLEEEAQKSSGVWISTAAGSTAAIRSAGGYVLALDSHDIQYLVREPCQPPKVAYRHLKGIRPLGEPFEVVSRMREGRVYVDGPHLAVDLGLGDVLSIHDDAPTLKIFGLDAKIRE